MAPLASPPFRREPPGGCPVFWHHLRARFRSLFHGTRKPQQASARLRSRLHVEELEDRRAPGTVLPAPGAAEVLPFGDVLAPVAWGAPRGRSAGISPRLLAEELADAGVPVPDSYRSGPRDFRRANAAPSTDDAASLRVVPVGPSGHSFAEGTGEPARYLVTADEWVNPNRIFQTSAYLSNGLGEDGGSAGPAVTGLAGPQGGRADASGSAAGSTMGGSGGGDAGPSGAGGASRSSSAQETFSAASAFSATG